MSRLPPITRVLRYWRDLSPPTLLVLSFAGLILGGALGFLVLPGLTTGPRLTVLEALFTSTSAVCLTGLTVVDVSTAFTRYGQAWLLLLVQLGGIGLVALTTLVIGALGRKLSLRSEMLTMPNLDFATRTGVMGLLGATATFTVIVEFVGAVALFLLWLPSHGAGEAAWLAVFHSVNAFCNAGFSIFASSLQGHATEASVVLVVSFLIVVGGFGYLSSAEILRWWRGGGRRGPRRLSTHTWAALIVTVVLLVSGTVLFAFFEWTGALAEFGTIDKLTNAWFMSATARSSGFSTVPYESLRNDSAYLSILLMIIGGSPGSTAGGIKTTAFAVLAAMAVSRMRGLRHVRLHRRTIPDGTVQRTVSLVALVFVVMSVALFALTSTETRGLDLPEARQAFLPLFFEAVSAFNTVGLSMSDAGAFSPAGKLLLIGLMFMGRVGPLAFFAALSLRSRAVVSSVRPAREDLVVG